VKVLLTIPLSIFSGYGRDGIGLTRALRGAGIDLYLRARSVQAPLPKEVYELFGKPLQAPFDLSITHVDPMAMELAPDAEASCETNIAWTMWEWLDCSHMKGRSSLKKRLKPFDAVVSYDEVTKEALSPYYSGPMLKQLGGSEFDKWKKLDRDWHEEDFYFGMVGAPLSQRKNPFVAVQAFSELKDEYPEFDKHARLMLKTSRDDKGLSPRMEDVYPGLRIFADSWGDAGMVDFYKHLHVLLSPSRGEGKHLPSLEFLATGGTVIGTNWGGMAEWMDEEFAYPLNNFTLESMDIAHTESLNASVDVKELKAHMLHCFLNRDEVAARGAKGAELVPQRHSWDAVVEGLFVQLRTLPNGEDLWSKYQLAKRESGSD